MKRNILIFGVLVALLMGVLSPVAAERVNAAPVQSHAAAVHVQSHPAVFDKTRFVLHLAVAAFLIHYIYKKYKEGKLSHFHFITDIKAGAAALLAYHELHVAYNIAKGSKSKTLHVLVSPINAIVNGLHAAASKLTHGDTSGVTALNGQVGSFANLAKREGYAFKDVAPAGFKNF